jgi:hypothetical protein
MSVNVFRGGIHVYHLSEREAFQAMSLFLRQFADRAGDDLATLLSDITIEKDGGTFDPAAWNDWMACVRSVAKGRESDDGPA